MPTYLPEHLAHGACLTAADMAEIALAAHQRAERGLADLLAEIRAAHGAERAELRRCIGIQTSRCRTTRAAFYAAARRSFRTVIPQAA